MKRVSETNFKIIWTCKRLLIKPKERQKIEKSKQDLNNKVDPVNLNITNIENGRNWTIIIQSKTDEDRNKIKNANYNGNFFQIHDEDLISKIKRQNQQLLEHDRS